MSLRLHHLRDQILVEDEWHALHVLFQTTDPHRLFTQLASNDHSIPLTLVDALLASLCGITELGMRAPSLMAGTLTLLLFPVCARRLVGRRVATVFVWLLAIAPLHVFYSRYARPYALVALFACTSLYALARWWDSGLARHAMLAVACAILAPWLHPASLPFVASSAIFAPLLSVARPGTGRPLRHLALLVLAEIIGWAALVAPPLVHDSAPVLAKVARGALSGPGIAKAWELFVGTSAWSLLMPAAVLVLLGALSVASSHPRWCVYLLSVSAMQLFAVALVKPVGIQYGIVLARYCFMLLPFVLLLLAAGLCLVDRRIASVVRYSSVASLGTAMVAALLWWSPLWRIYGFRSNFANTGALQYDYDPSYFERFRPAIVSPFYAQMSALPAGSVTLLEAPWYFYWNTHAYTQRLHGQRVMVGFVDRDPDHARAGEVPRVRRDVRLRGCAHVADLAAVERAVDYVVFHTRLPEEAGGPFADQPVDVSEWVSLYRSRFGEPIYQDPYLTVFALGARNVPGP